MFCRKGTHSVVKIIRLYSDVRKATTRMNNIGARESESSPDTNNSSYNLQNAPPTFEELVFSPTGLANTSKYADKQYDATIKELMKLLPSDINTRKTQWKRKTTVTTLEHLERSGLSLSTLEEKLSIIHVAGTKGKGSTCALVEAILRQYGVRTGFFSSPHLLSANERIRINGDPLDKDKFTKHFWPVYNRLMAHRTHEADMPGFFAFMTILGFHVFVAEQVDVLVLEVGIGGELDSTNIVRNIRTAGITSLALEHTALLGDTLTKIAWQKAGIIKEQSYVYTHVTQPECLKVIHERAAERHAHVVEVPSTEEYFRRNQCLDLLESCNDYVRLNGSLAVQLAYDWLRQTTGPHHRDIAVNDPKLSEEAKRGLINVHWPGRCQLVDYQNMRVHLDGAHTVESIRVCCDWFIKSTRSSQKNPKILLFNRTGDTDTRALLEVLLDSSHFDMVCFVPNMASADHVDPNQPTLYNITDSQLKRAQLIGDAWQQLVTERGKPDRSHVYPTVLDALCDVRQHYPEPIQLDVLITGSLHLLGAAITAFNRFPPKQENGCAKSSTRENK